ncbi:hypothetical protein CDV31_015361 [Fusarium ambrosium]|uniref:Uncharacterized protein n=1 Tax=Fusarium ambrosium TaxID=131363 RepID=A0A428SQC1_9HYPO|nr:hypothetical protein CDV31_015361 [Fusarium ambrosium]
MLELNPCESCGAWYSQLLEKPASTGEYVHGGQIEIKSLIRGNIVLGREDVCDSCLILAKTAITLRPSLYTQGLSDFKDLMVCFDLVNLSEGVVNTTASWYRGGGSNLLFRQAITVSELDHLSPSVSISVAKESRSSAKSKQNLGVIKKMLNLREAGHGCHHNCNREPWTSDDFDVDCLLSVKDALRAFDDDDLEYLSDPTSFTATAWIMWLGYGALVLGNDLDSKDFQRLGYLDASKPGSSGHMSPVDDLELWVDSVKGTVMQFRLV